MVDGEGLEARAVEMQKYLTWQMPLYRRDQTLAKQFKDDRCASINHTVLSCIIIAKLRRIDLNEKALFAKPPDPELLTALQMGKRLENNNKLEGISLVNRGLRRARMWAALLVGADLRLAQFQGADLGRAQLQEAQLQGADLSGALLQNADLRGALLQDQYRGRALLQGADLRWARLQGISAKIKLPRCAILLAC